MQKTVRAVLPVLAGICLLGGCASVEVPIDYKAEILRDRDAKNQVAREDFFENPSDKELLRPAAASLFTSASPNYSKYFETAREEYGAIWICPPEEAFAKFQSISQAEFGSSTVRMVQFDKNRRLRVRVTTNCVDSVELLKAGQIEYWVARAGKKLSLYMYGNDAVIELAFGPYDFEEDQKHSFQVDTGSLYQLLKAKTDAERREIEWAQAREKEKQKALAAKAAQEAEEKAYIAEQQAKQQKELAERKAQEAEWAARAAERKKKEDEENKRQTEAALAAEAARVAAENARIAQIDQRAVGINPSYRFSGKTLFDFFKATLKDGKSLSEQSGEVFEIRPLSNPRVSWEVLQCIDAKNTLICARGDDFSLSQSYRHIIDNSTFILTRKNKEELLIEGQPIRRGFVVLVGTQAYTAVSGAKKTVPAFRLLFE